VSLALVKVVFPALVVTACIGFAAYLFDYALRSRVLIDGSYYTILGDDVLISLRYAYNLAHGSGLVWNPGEAVLGITNLGWTLVASVFYLLGASLVTAPLLLRLLNIALHAGLVAWLALWGWRRGRPGAGAVAAILVALDAPIMTWGLLGFETTAQAILVTAAVLPLLDDRPLRWSLMWAALATMIRLDAFLIYVILLGVAVVLDRRRVLVLPLVLSLALLITLFLGQRLVYGSVLPNTYALKATRGAATFERGLMYLWRFTWEQTFALPLLLAPVVFAGWRTVLGLCLSPRILIAAALPYLWVAYVVWVGGDAFPYGRFFVVVVPLLAVFAGLLVDEMARAWRTVFTPVLLAFLIVGLFSHVQVALPILRAATQASLSDVVSAACLALGIQGMDLPVGRVIGVYYAGMTPYLLPQHRAHDFLGKSDRHIARSRAHAGPPGHNKWDYTYSLGVVRPDLIVTSTFAHGGQIKARDIEEDYGFYPALWLDPIFAKEYQPHRLWPPPGEGAWHHQWIYARADLVSPRPFVIPTGVCRSGP
jgi:hypothetical protein